MSAAQVALEPAGIRAWLGDAIEAGGGAIVDPADAEALVWAETAKPDELAALLAAHPNIAWVQLPWAGIEPYREVLDPARTWTCGKGVYAEPVAELALALALAGLRGVGDYARKDCWSGQQGRNLLDARVTILGGGGIAASLIRLLEPFNARVTVVRRDPKPLGGAERVRVVGVDELHGALAGADVVVLALALTPETAGIIGARELVLLGPHTWIVNVARGRHIVTDALVAALRGGTIGGAALDVTEPEPLPDGHPLWSIPNCIITPHVGNTAEMALPLLSARISENVRRWAAGEPLLGPVDPARGY